MNTNYRAHSLGLGIKGRMPQEPADEFGRPVIRHVQPNQAVTRVRPIRATEFTIEAKKVGCGSRCNAGIRFSSSVPQAARSRPTTRKCIRHLRSKSRCAAGRFSSSTNIEPPEWLVFDDHIRDGNCFANCLLGNPAIPLLQDFPPCQAAIELFQDNPHHDACAFERRLAAANLRVGDDMAPQFDSPADFTCLRFHINASHYAPAGERLQAVRDSRPLRCLL